MLPNSNGNFTGKVAFVTGAANGIGRATALKPSGLIEQGFADWQPKRHQG